MCGCCGGKDDEEILTPEHHIARVPHKCSNDNCGKDIPTGARYYVENGHIACSTSCLPSSVAELEHSGQKLLFA